ncbi:16S rRNA (guanine(966)-N(2))-methyltransferase RsmD [Chlamydia sp. 17-3921]|uniref:16S rRNA (guanine(966)-N(2))-methyltransferase RsmD n=1 Tax=Chlamydia sp. 17-3921 TaxID=2675798 RepID=UPI001F40A802|nr:16S rRNA (guanine(966)-N(2))-methyltransferase RsmD [Chlamydia sp. 17-3921]
MKILAGKYKGQSLKSFSDRSIRPTCGLVKEALFNICISYLEGAAFLDLFAGIGGVGFEALSRGASSVVFVDTSVQAIRLIRANSKLLEAESLVSVVKHDAKNAIQKLAKKQLTFDLIYIDPPYDLEDLYIENLLKEIVKENLLLSDGLLFLESASKDDILIEGLVLRNKRKLGDTFLSEYIVEKF